MIEFSRTAIFFRIGIKNLFDFAKVAKMDNIVGMVHGGKIVDTKQALPFSYPLITHNAIARICKIDPSKGFMAKIQFPKWRMLEIKMVKFR